MAIDCIFVRCFDGDTLDVRTAGGVIVRVRLWGIDAPEHGQVAFRRSRAFLRGLCEGEPLVLYPRGLDLYQRTIARVKVAGRVDVSEAMLQAGWAWWYRQFCKKDLYLGRLEWEAKQARRGLWAEDAPVPPWAWRHGTRGGRFVLKSRRKMGCP